MLILLFSIVTIFVISAGSSSLFNLRKARSLKVPLVYIPFDVNSILWLLIQPLVWKLLAYLPVNWSSYPDFVRFSHRNWHFLEKSRPIERFGPVWALVSPGGIHIHVSDPDAIEEIFSRWKDFVRPLEKYKVLTIFGPSVFNVGLEDWPRHRKAISAPMTPSIMSFVWEETIRQTNGMLDHWTSLNGNGASRMSEDLRSISLNILAASAFGESYNFRQFNDNGAPDSYRDTLFMVHRYIVPLMLIPYRFLKPGIVPGQLAKIGTAANALQSFMRKLALDEVDALNMGKAASRGLIPSLASSLIRKTTIEMDAENNHNGGKRKMGLSIDEVCGNIFVMNFAGHDTTANVVTFIMVLLTAHPDVQQWLRDEIVEVTRGKPTEEWELSLWTHLKRCRAVLLETLRLYAPITGIPKRTSNRWQELRVGQQVLEIPPGIEIFPLLIGVQTDPTHWEDPYTWRPSRWIIKPQPGSSLQCENLVVQRKGVYFPWSAGPQNCIGQEFSQVETVAMLACIFGRYEVCSKRNIGETAEHARMKALACVDDVNYEMLLKMNQPDSIGLECSKILY